VSTALAPVAEAPARPVGARAVLPGAQTPEQEALFLLAGTAARRAAARGRLLELADTLDLERFTRAARRQGLLALAGSRLRAVAGERLPGPFHAEIAVAHREAAMHALLVGSVTRRLLAALERGGIVAVPLKGPLLAAQIHADQGLRAPSADIDIVVAPESLAAAIATLAGEGYAPPAEPAWRDGLPGLFECSLLPLTRWLPPIDLHWRTHWYEEEFTRALLSGSTPGPDGWRRVEPAHELAALLLCFVRDGFWGLRLAADLAAWWDLRSPRLAVAALDPIVERHPELQRALTAATLALEAATGVPSAGLLSPSRSRGARVRAAARLLNWGGQGDARRFEAHTALVDLLLAPRRGLAAFVRRRLLLPGAVIASVYRLPERAPVRRRARRAWYCGVTLKNVLPPAVRALWRVRGGRTYAAIP
jgi:hypothetical protein